MKNKYHVILSNIDHIDKVGHTTMICATYFIICAAQIIIVWLLLWNVCTHLMRGRKNTYNNSTTDHNRSVYTYHNSNTDHNLIVYTYGTVQVLHKRSRGRGESAIALIFAYGVRGSQPNAYCLPQSCRLWSEIPLFLVF